MHCLLDPLSHPYRISMPYETARMEWVLTKIFTEVGYANKHLLIHVLGEKYRFKKDSPDNLHLHYHHTWPSGMCICSLYFFFDSVFTLHIWWEICCLEIYVLVKIAYHILAVIGTALICLGSKKNEVCASTWMWIYIAWHWIAYVMGAGLKKGVRYKQEVRLSSRWYGYVAVTTVLVIPGWNLTS